MNGDYSKRAYLLPEGCKDLIDVLNLQKKTAQGRTVHPSPPSNEAKDEFQAEFECLAKLDQEWRDHFGQPE